MYIYTLTFNRLLFSQVFYSTYENGEEKISSESDGSSDDTDKSNS